MFKKLKIRTKLVVFTSFFASLTLILGLCSYYGQRQLIKNQRLTTENRLPAILALSKIKEAQLEISASERGLYMYEMMTDAYREQLYTAIEKSILKSKEGINEFEALTNSKEEMDIWKEFITAWNEYMAIDSKIIAYSKEISQMIVSDHKTANGLYVDKKNEMMSVALPSKQSSDIAITKITKLFDLSQKAINTDGAQVITTANKFLLFMVLIALFSYAGSIILGHQINSGIQKILTNIVKQINKLVDDIENGNVTSRADVNATNFEFRDITVGLNKMIEAFHAPLQMSSEFIGNVGKGIIPQKNNIALKGYFDDMRKSANNSVDGLQGLVEANKILQGMALNDYTNKVEGDYVGIYKDVCNAVNLVRGRINHTIEICQRISEGDLSDKEVLKEIGKRSEHDKLTPSVLKMSNAISNMIIDTNSLVNASVDGKLSVRADVSKHQGNYAKVIQGINDTLDALVGPMTVTADYISKISIGDMPPVITEKYNGDFKTIIDNLNSLINALNEIIAKTKLVAEGDLTVDLKKRSQNDVLMQSLTDMVKSTANIINEFQTATNNISASSQQMSSTSQQMSQGASEQASSTEEVSSSMEEMAANIQQNTENARQTEKIALNASDEITKAAESAQKTIKYMQEITDKVSIIGEIASQTNLLALNAAVEAARAGEYGKGFAVVAAEIRKLAERSQIAAVEIDTLTRTSLRATNEAGVLMTAIVPEISKTGKLVQEISAASMEQNSGAEQVNNAIQQLNQVTQQNAAASEEMATSSEELAGQAQQLMEMISFFKLETNNL